MASKQLGKLRQWAGEVMSREKTNVSDEFRELEDDIDLRRHGVKRLLTASTAYHHVLSKKREFSVVLDDPAEYLPIEALGMVMVLHGEEFPKDSAFGSSLVKFGRAHCKLATLQEAYAVSLRSTFIASMVSLVDEMKDCKLQRKKLESRRLSYDAAMSKAEKLKNSKKEKDKKEAEDELQQAKLRYEEMAEDVRSRMIAIQDNEISQLRELTSFLDLELHFATQYLDVLKNAKAECNDSVVNNCGIPRSLKRHEAENDMSSSEGEMESKSPATSSRRSSFNRQKSGSISKESSKPPLGNSRKLSASANNSGGEKEKEKSEKLGGRKLSVAGWASSAVGSVTKKGKDTFAALTGGGVGERLSDGEGEEPIAQSFSSSYLKKSPTSKPKDLGGASPKVAGKILKPPALQSRRLVRATHDFNGSSEELSFKTGDEIVVLNEVLDEWWMGELDGKKGLFPTVYTEVVDINGDHRDPRPPLEKSEGSLSSSESYDSSDLDGEQLYMARPVTLARAPYLGHPDTASITSNPAEENQTSKHPTIVIPPSLTRSHSANFSIAMRPSSTENITKRPPPPPPPRRSASNGPVSSPPLPERKPGSFRCTPSPATAALPTLTPSLSSTSSHNYEVSPFESASDVTTERGCQSFQQHPFKVPGMCSNCFTMHI